MRYLKNTSLVQAGSIWSSRLANDFAADAMLALAVQCEKARILQVIRVPHDVRQRAATPAERVQLARQAGTGDAWPLLTANLNFTAT